MTTWCELLSCLTVLELADLLDDDGLATLRRRRVAVLPGRNSKRCSMTEAAGLLEAKYGPDAMGLARIPAPPLINVRIHR